MAIDPEKIRRAVICNEMGKQLYLDLLETPDVHDRLATAMWLVVACSVNHPAGYEWCKNMVTTMMETAPVVEIARQTIVLNNARPGK